MPIFLICDIGYKNDNIVKSLYLQFITSRAKLCLLGHSALLQRSFVLANQDLLPLLTVYVNKNLIYELYFVYQDKLNTEKVHYRCIFKKRMDTFQNAFELLFMMYNYYSQYLAYQQTISTSHKQYLKKISEMKSFKSSKKHKSEKSDPSLTSKYDEILGQYGFQVNRHLEEDEDSTDKFIPMDPVITYLN